VEELRPSGTGPSRSGIDAVTFEDRPDARWGEHDAHPGELAMDPPIAPGRVLASQPHDKGGGACRDRGSTGSAVWVGPVSADEVSVPTQQGGWLDEEAFPARPR
jgi:hypothetical protein